MKYCKKRNTSLKIGDSGIFVKELQKDMRKLGYNIENTNGVFDYATKEAVKSFQERHFITGTVDFETAYAIHSRLAVNEKQHPDISFIPSPNFGSRKGHSIDMVIIHFTANSSLNAVVKWFKNPTSNVSVHYIVGKDGMVVQMVADDDRAWHAGKSQWCGASNCNDFSIGVEVVNWGLLKERDGKLYCWPGDYTKEYSGSSVEIGGYFWDTYTEEQYHSLIPLIVRITKKYNIPVERVLGHSDIAPDRKKDPGKHFDWKRLRNGLA